MNGKKDVQLHQVIAVNGMIKRSAERSSLFIEEA